MKPAICTSFNYSIPFEEAIPMIRNSGFDLVSIGANPGHSGYATSAGRRAIRKLLGRYGLMVDSVHAPFPGGDRLFSLDDNERLASIRQCRTALDAAVELEGGRIVVLHLIQPYGIPHGGMRDRMIEQGRRVIGQLAEAALACDVKLALENGQKQDYDDVLANLLAEFNEPHVGFCYDSGHENVQGKCFSLLEKFGNRLFTVHIHDNNGKDTHLLPHEGIIDWREFRAVIHSLDYHGNILLETSMENSRYKDPGIFLARAWQFAADICRS